MTKRMLFSKAAHHIEGQPMFKVLDLVQRMEKEGENIIHFEIGDPDFATPRHIIDAAYDSMLCGDTHYTNSMGLYELREAASDATQTSRGFRPLLSQVLVTPGANIIIYLTVQCLVNPGEEVIFPDPGFPTYYSVIKFCGAKPVRIPLREKNKFQMNPDDVRKSITDKTKLIIINSPSNPTGSMMTPEQIDEIYKIAAKRGVYLLSDEIYSRMRYEDTPFHSPSRHDKCLQHTILLNGFSKAFAMTGWRLGVAIGPPPVIEKMGLLVQTLCSCVPPFIQKAGVAALRCDQGEIRRMMQIYKERRELIVEGLNSIEGIRCLRNEGAFYVFPSITGTGMTCEEFSDFMLAKAHVALLPGTNFGKNGKGYVRLSYATAAENITEGLRRMKRALGQS